MVFNCAPPQNIHPFQNTRQDGELDQVTSEYCLSFCALRRSCTAFLSEVDGWMDSDPNPGGTSWQAPKPSNPAISNMSATTMDYSHRMGTVPFAQSFLKDRMELVCLRCVKHNRFTGVTQQKPKSLIVFLERERASTANIQCKSM